MVLKTSMTKTSGAPRYGKAILEFTLEIAETIFL